MYDVSVTDGSVLPGGSTDSSVNLVHEDPYFVVVDKPAGLLSVPGRGTDKQDCLARRVAQHYADAQVVHRLDMGTSGLWLAARGAAMQRALSIAFAQRRVDKRYQAVVDGLVAAPDSDDGWGLIDLPLAADWPNRPRQVVDRARGKPSQTRWRVLSRDRVAGTSRLELAPLTGRSHQIRVHLQALGHPILGDALYAPPEVQARAPRLLLHASELAFAHPVTGQSVTVVSAPAF